MNFNIYFKIIFIMLLYILPKQKICNVLKQYFALAISVSSIRLFQ